MKLANTKIASFDPTERYTYVKGNFFSIIKSTSTTQFVQLRRMIIQNAAALREHTLADVVSSIRRQQSRYHFDADAARLRPVSASVHQHS